MAVHMKMNVVIIKVVRCTLILLVPIHVILPSDYEVMIVVKTVRGKASKLFL